MILKTVKLLKSKYNQKKLTSVKATPKQLLEAMAPIF